MTIKLFVSIQHNPIRKSWCSCWYLDSIPYHQDFDVFGDGLIGVEDLLHVYRKLGDDEITVEEVEQMVIDATGTPKRKKATFEEFKAVLKEY